MPNIQSAKKRVRVTSAKTLQNKMVKSALKTNIKAIEAELAENKNPEAVSRAYKAIDKAAAKGVINKKAAANKKSGIAKMAK